MANFLSKLAKSANFSLILKILNVSQAWGGQSPTDPLRGDPLGGPRFPPEKFMRGLMFASFDEMQSNLKSFANYFNKF